jgi:RNA polymerase sigma factor (sigma-70 family)
MRIGSRVRLRFAADDRLVSLLRRGDVTAFELLYDRHARELLSFARNMLDSPQDAEDAVQSTFASAYRALVADEREVDLRPWLFAITRNACLSILRQRRGTVEILDATTAPRSDPEAQLERREDLRQALASLLELPERQRAALILAELHGLTHSEIGTVLEVRAEQVKSYVYQARSSLSSERQARGADCAEIREELATARGAALLRSHLRRHLRACPGCRSYAEEVSRQRRALGLLLPVAPAIALKRRALEVALGRAQHMEAWVAGTTGPSLAGATAELGDGGANTLLVKLLAGIACLAAAGAGTVATSGSATHRRHTAQAAGPGGSERLQLAASAGPVTVPGVAWPSSLRVEPPPAGGELPAMGSHPPAPVVEQQRPQGPSVRNGSEPRSTESRAAGSRGEEPHSRSEGPRGKGGEASAPGKSEEPHGKSEAAPGQGNSEGPHGNSEGPHGKSEEPHGKSEEAEGPGKSEEPHGKSEAVPGQSNGEEPHGDSAGKAKAAHEGASGKSEESHGAKH